MLVAEQYIEYIEKITKTHNRKSHKLVPESNTVKLLRGIKTIQVSVITTTTH